MRTLNRRRFAQCAGAAVAGIITARKGSAAETHTQSVEIQAASEIGRINPELHASFAEHLGSCIYGGLWVGKNSSIPNINGYRRQAVEWLRELGLVVLRWPGGCFADDYHWRDGIGPVEKRPKIVNIHWGNYVEDNSFGTHEFIGLCRLIGAEPYIAGNVGSGTPQELRDWVEYCNFPSGSSLADERAANGSPEPFRVRYWGIGNENWGCGGNMTAEEYAAHYRRFATYVRPMGDTRPFPVACGPSSNNLDWTKRFFSSMPAARGGPAPGRGPAPGGPTSGYAMHFYIRGPVLPTKFNASQLREQLATFASLERAIVEQRALMDTFDPGRRWGLIVDEWGIWDAMDPAEEKQFGRLWMQSTMRTAVAGALGLNVFHRQADKLYMCNIAQTVNVLQSVILAHGNDCIRTSTYYAFLMQKPHRGKIAVRAYTGDPSPLALSVSASKGEGELVATFVNPREDVQLKVNCGIAGAKLLSGKGQILYHPDFNACNTFKNPDVLVPRDHPVTVEASRLQFELPPVAIVSVVLRTA